jgi:hypothetical protein
MIFAWHDQKEIFALPMFLVIDIEDIDRSTSVCAHITRCTKHTCRERWERATEG